MTEATLTPEIPAFLRRTKQADPEPESLETETVEIEATPENLSASLAVILDRIKELVAKRDGLTEAISKHKKAAQKIIGRM
jgi:hypothetical protein